MKLEYIFDNVKKNKVDIDLFFQQSEMELTKWRTQIRDI